jgi:subtilisin family serine protease
MRNLIVFLALILISFNSFASDSFSGWGVASINLPSKITSKSEVRVAVLDTGIDGTHEFLSNNLIESYDFSKTGNSDKHGHGTHVAGIVKSIFPSVKLISLKYYNPRFSGKESLDATLAGLRKAVELNVDIINYSGGGPEASSEELAILKDAEKKGILVVCAAGNEGSNIDDKKHAFYPAAYGLSNIITVSGHDEDNKLVDSSNYGKNAVDIAAPGKRIKSSLPLNRSGFLTGTSQATAFVTGVAALLKSNDKNLSASEIKRIIRSSAKKEKSLKNYANSNGRLDASAAINFSGEKIPSIMGQTISSRN